jgi:hypothetical protein
MLSKLPNIGNRRATRKFTFKEVDTEDGFRARFRFVYGVEIYRGKKWLLNNGKYSPTGWILEGYFSTSDNANASINMKVLQESTDKEQAMNEVKSMSNWVVPNATIGWSTGTGLTHTDPGNVTSTYVTALKNMVSDLKGIIKE